jgi:23S rRNA (adenine2503-C2)-methyltransferase
MACSFCATGQMGFARQLSAAEIFEQALGFAQLLQSRNSLLLPPAPALPPPSERLSNVVFMGMGEPLANYKNVLAAVHRIHAELGISYRNITISTVGLVPMIRRLAGEGVPLSLAVSLHAVTDATRAKLMPIATKPGHSVAEVRTPSCP